MTLTIDGVEVTVPKGTLVIRAAEQVGTYIPRFCDHPLLAPLGACRQCMVEVEGQRKPLTSCTTPATDGMVVRTHLTSELARDAQEGVLEMLLINHPLDCPMCDKGGECPLQDQALAYGPGGSRYDDPKRRFTKPVPVSPLVKLDRERCVLCARCTRFADQISGDPFIELFERGALEQVAIFEDEPYESIFSGNVVQICPVGALTATPFRFRARPFDMSTTATTCNRCASGCSIEVQERRGQLVRVMAGNDPAVNDEWICDKGRFGYAYSSSSERVTEPLIRKNGEFVPVSWSEAFGAIGDGIAAARASGDRIGVLGGAQLCDEDSYALSRFARTVLSTNDIDHRMRAGSDEEEHVLLALPKTVTATNADIDAASVIVVTGIDLQQESPIVYLRVRKAQRRGARVIEVSARGSALVASGARWIACSPGGEAAGLSALREDGIVVLAGDRLASSPGALTAAWNLAVSSGGRFGWIPRKAGSRGAVDAGVHPALLPGGRSVRWAPHRAHVEEVWGATIPEDAGRGARAMLSGGLGMLYLVGADPARELDVGEDLDRVGFFVAQGMFLTATSHRAHVVLPAAVPYERAGTLTNWEGRARAVAPTVPAAGLSQPDAEIMMALAAAIGAPFPRTMDALRAEMRALAQEPHPAEALAPVAPLAPGTQNTTPEFPLTLVSAPTLLEPGPMLAGAMELLAAAAKPFIEVSAATGERFGLSEGTAVRVASRVGSMVAPLRFGAVVDDVVFAPDARGFGPESFPAVRLEIV